MLGLLGLRSTKLHNNLILALSRFHRVEKSEVEHLGVLVGMDLTARRLLISNVDTVVNYRLPRSLE